MSEKLDCITANDLPILKIIGIKAGKGGGAMSASEIRQTIMEILQNLDFAKLKIVLSFVKAIK